MGQQQPRPPPRPLLGARPRPRRIGWSGAAAAGGDAGGKAAGGWATARPGRPRPPPPNSEPWKAIFVALRFIWNFSFGRAAREGQVEFLRVLLSHGAAITSAPLPANAAGKTPLDLALDFRNLQCVELLLANEVSRPPPLRLAVMKAWSRLAADMPSVLVKFLQALGFEELTDAVGSSTVMVSVQEGTHLITCGSQDYAVNQELWADMSRKPPSEMRLPVYMCGLPYVALTTRSVKKSPLGVLMLNNVNDAFTTDIVFAMLTYKWDTYAGRIYRRQALLYGSFMVLYITATTLGVEWSKGVSREEMYGYGTTRTRVAVRILLEGCVLLLNAWYLWEEIVQISRHGPVQYFTGHNSAWNWVELLSCLMVKLVVVLQVIGLEEARWVMSACTILLGTRLLKVASGYEGTGIYLQIIIRIIADLRHYLLIVLVTLLTYALAFRHIMVYYDQIDNDAGISSEFTRSFDGFPKSLLSVYYFMTGGGFPTDVDGEPKYLVWYLHAMLISFSFMVSIILLNLLIAVMSDTYMEVKQHAKSEWMLLKARLVLEIDSNMPDSFFTDRRRSAPRWLHVVNTKHTSASPLDTIRGTVGGQASNGCCTNQPTANDQITINNEPAD
ncbi:hypothetical protein VOLCADRAFT_98374 [Volvox carteri f. nagariensis]|uniref:Ion transport domain-containing protein n=1 Tax=Volvox carteri f. nagariensis TaxID=3068 RepID=D8UF63_VOLCA|nr:uncharacterized protein VOLCADRAFT_98374 [Volvox carteri f. nagariensis]EFJ41626.1 hypothetical protein VOLCADRAFT_98374 [Volvox carteri f. nagariensis]|eukprot:XP_002957282.1 hypothetical protein VOLCADRAFT_98374 [Volvox carteri f. nagariensis]